MLFAGIDGGQSSTIAVVIDASGAVLGRGTAGPSDHVDEDAESPRAARACETALAAALAAAGARADVPLEAAVIGVSGYEGEWHGATPAIHAPIVRYVNDAPIALAGAISSRPAAIVIGGTGSVAFAESATGRTYRVGGYGFLFGDDGSAFAIARTALASAMRACDRGVTTDLAEAALAFFDMVDLRAFARAVSLKHIKRPEVAAFARVVFDAARLGDPEARSIVEQAAAALGSLAGLAVQHVDPGESTAVPVALIGGSFENAEFRAAVERHLGGVAPHARAVTAQAEPAVGAALLACEAAGHERPLALHAPE